MIIITGQTATGKTDLAFQYAKKYNGEIINFDSRQIYKYLDIITGKDIPKNSKLKIKNSKLTYYLITIHQPPTTNHQPQSTKLWLYDIITPDQYFSSFEYVKLAQKVIKDIKNRGKIPILVGGSYFYLKHLLYGFDYKVPPNFKLREELNKKSVNELQDILKGLSSPKTLPKMNQSDWHNPRRLIRRIEILQGQSFSRTVLKKESQKLLEKNSLFIGLRYQNKDKLRQAIIKRVEKRLAQGAIDEVKRILKMGYKKTDPGLKTIGYKQLIEYLEALIRCFYLNNFGKPQCLYLQH